MVNLSTHNRDLVKDFLDRHRVSAKFRNNRPGAKWFREFAKRHKGQIVIRNITIPKLATSRSMINNTYRM